MNKMERGKISIIIPAYNAEKTIKQLLLQILSQTYENIEVIIVNDGSTDSTQTICESIKDERIVLFNISNHGQGYARNYGLNKAHGEFIGFCDADDEIELDMYEILYRMIVENNADMACCGHCDITNEGLIERRSSDKGCLNKKEALKSFAEGKIKWAVWDKIFRLDKIGNLRFLDKKYRAQDVIFLLDFIKNNDTFCYEDLGKYHYRRDNPDSYTKRKWNPANYGLTLFYKSLYESMCKLPKLAY